MTNRSQDKKRGASQQPDERKKFRISKHNVRNLFKPLPDPRIEDLLDAKERLSIILRQSMFAHKGAKSPGAKKEEMNNRASQESLDLTRTEDANKGEQ